MRDRPRDPRRRGQALSAYRNLAIPEHIREELSEAMEMSEDLIAMQGGDLPTDPKARRIEALHKIVAEWATEARHEHEYFMSKAPVERRNKWAAKRRDGFKCLRCGSTGLNNGSIASHHVVPKGARGDPLYDAVTRKMGSIDAVENLATLCERCHQAWAHAGWRKAAAWLFKKMGVEL